MPSLLPYRRTAFGVCLDLIGGETLASNQSLYLRASNGKAAPKCISGSTSYLPHPEAFQRLLVRTSIRCYPDFILDKGRSLGFASATPDYCALFRLAFAAAARLTALNLAGHGNS